MAGVAEQAAGRAPERTRGHRVRRRPPCDVIELCLAAVTAVGYPLLSDYADRAWAWSYRPRADFAWLGWNLTELTWEQMADVIGFSAATLQRDFRYGRGAGWTEKRVEMAVWVQRKFDGGLIWLPI